MLGVEDLLRRHVPRRPHGHPRLGAAPQSTQLGQPEVRDAGHELATLALGNQHVAWLEVTMHQAGPMGRPDASQDLQGQVEPNRLGGIWVVVQPAIEAGPRPRNP